MRIKPEDLKQKGIVYIGHLPKGFEEDELKRFFGQFGEVSKLKLARSKKTARSKGYGFLEFKDKEVGEIAVNTMNGYMMFGKQIQCHMVDTPHKDTFKHGNREWNYAPTQLIFRNKKNEPKSKESMAAKVAGLLEKEKEKRIRLKELGIEYDFPGYQALVDARRQNLPAASQKTEKKDKKSKK